MLNIAVSSRLHENGYRYKREAIQVVHEHFKGAVTRITNLASIAKQLQTPAQELETGFVKYVKKSMGISTCGPVTFPGTRQASEFDAVLQKMIEKFILCPQCILPEWNGIRCAACGYRKEKSGKETKTSKDDATHQYDILTECVSLEDQTAPWVVELSRYMNTVYDTLKKCPEKDKKTLNCQLDLCWKIESEIAWENFKNKNNLQ